MFSSFQVFSSLQCIIAGKLNIPLVKFIQGIIPIFRTFITWIIPLYKKFEVKLIMQMVLGL